MLPSQEELLKEIQADLDRENLTKTEVESTEELIGEINCVKSGVPRCSRPKQA